MPWIAQLREKYLSRGFEVLGILTNEVEAAKLHTLLEKNGVQYPILKCNHTTAQAYGEIPVLPESFYIDRRGVVGRREQ
jgi:hypothetical protein